MKKLKLKENEVVHCATLKQAKKVLKIAHELGLTWCNNISYKKNNDWDLNKEATVYYLHEGKLGHVEYVKEEYTIITSKEFIKRHKKTSLKKRVKSLEDIVNGTNESKEEKEYTLDKSITHDISNYTEEQLKELHKYLIITDDDWNDCAFEEMIQNYKEWDLQFDTINWTWIKKEPKIGDVVKAWDDDKSKFVYGVLNHVEPYVIGTTYYACVEKVTEISINDFKK